jgi:hypothetical protein
MMSFEDMMKLMKDFSEKYAHETEEAKKAQEEMRKALEQERTQKEQLRGILLKCAAENANLKTNLQASLKEQEGLKDHITALVQEVEACKAEKREIEARLRGEIEAVLARPREISKIERLIRHFADMRNAERQVDIHSVNPFRVGDKVVVKFDGKDHYGDIWKINQRTLSIRTQTGRPLLVTPKNVKKVVFANDPEYYNQLNSNQEEEDNSGDSHQHQGDQSVIQNFFEASRRCPSESSSESSESSSESINERKRARESDSDIESNLESQSQSKKLSLDECPDEADENANNDDLHSLSQENWFSEQEREKDDWSSISSEDSSWVPNK